MGTLSRNGECRGSTACEGSLGCGLKKQTNKKLRSVYIKQNKTKRNLLVSVSWKPKRMVSASAWDLEQS